MLEITDIHTYYGFSHVLQGISLNVSEREILGLIGRNGVGKTTTLHSVIGFCRPVKGNIIFQGKNLVGFPIYKIVQEGISIVPQGRRIFPSLTVKENLEVGVCKVKKGEGWSLEEVYWHFPALRERSENKGNQLSGGEAQMLAIGRALMNGPQLLLMDEPSEGLAPIILKALTSTWRQLRDRGLTILLAEQNMHIILDVADRVYVINKGKIVFESKPDSLWTNEEIKSKYVGV